MQQLQALRSQLLDQVLFRFVLVLCRVVTCVCSIHFTHLFVASLSDCSPPLQN